MRTTLNLPEELIDEARKILKLKSKTATVVLALRELVRQRRIAEMKALVGTVNLELDVPASRRRPGSRKLASKHR